MPRIVIRGSAAVFHDDDDEQISDPGILQSLSGLVYDDERFTDYLGGWPEEDALAAALEPGGIMSFAYCPGACMLSATTEYRARRSLSNAELQLLVNYTLGQWSDGIGENWTCISEEKCGYRVMCLAAGEDGTGPDYPEVEVHPD